MPGAPIPHAGPPGPEPAAVGADRAPRVIASTVSDPTRPCRQSMPDGEALPHLEVGPAVGVAQRVDHRPGIGVGGDRRRDGPQGVTGSAPRRSRPRAGDEGRRLDRLRRGRLDRGGRAEQGTPGRGGGADQDDGHEQGDQPSAPDRASGDRAALSAPIAAGGARRSRGRRARGRRGWHAGADGTGRPCAGPRLAGRVRRVGVRGSQPST